MLLYLSVGVAFFYYYGNAIRSAIMDIASATTLCADNIAIGGLFAEGDCHNGRADALPSASSSASDDESITSPSSPGSSPIEKTQRTESEEEKKKEYLLEKEENTDCPEEKEVCFASLEKSDKARVLGSGSFGLPNDRDSIEVYKGAKANHSSPNKRDLQPSSSNRSADCDSAHAATASRQRRRGRLLFDFGKNLRRLPDTEEHGEDNEDDDETASTVDMDEEEFVPSWRDSERERLLDDLESKRNTVVRFEEDLVTAVYTRPVTTEEEKPLLYYDESDYASFKLRRRIEQLQGMHLK